MLRTLQLFFDSNLCSTVKYVPSARLYSNPIHVVQDYTHICIEQSCEDLISWMFLDTILWQAQTNVVVTLCKPIWPSYQLYCPTAQANWLQEWIVWVKEWTYLPSFWCDELLQRLLNLLPLSISLILWTACQTICQSNFGLFHYRL